MTATLLEAANAAANAADRGTLADDEKLAFIARAERAGYLREGDGDFFRFCSSVWQNEIDTENGD